MTRFWITLEQGARFVARCIEQMNGGEIFVPKIPSMKLIDMAEAVAPGCEVECVGIRPGEKLHEVLLSEDEARNSVEMDDMYVVRPAHSWWRKENWGHARPLEDGDAAFAADGRHAAGVGDFVCGPLDSQADEPINRDFLPFRMIS